MPDSSRRDVLISTLLSKPRDVLTSVVVVTVQRLTGRRLGDEDAASATESRNSTASAAESRESVDAASSGETDDE